MLLAAPLLIAATAPEPAGRWFISVDDYPREALRDRLDGTTRYEMAVGADGKPLDCTIVKSSGHAVLDQQTCTLLMKRAKFKPARDDMGNAIAGIWSRPVVWDPFPQPNGPGYSGYGVAVRFDDKGEVSSCKVTPLSEISRVTPDQADKCRTLGTTAVFAELLARPTSGLATATFRLRRESARAGALLRSNEPVQRVLAHVEFDRTKERAISWCEAKVAPLTPLLGLGDTALCGPKAFGVTTTNGGGHAEHVIYDVVATR